MVYDKKQEYEEEIAPIVTELKRACIKHHLPFFFTTCVANDECNSEYVKEIYSSLTSGVELSEDYFVNLIKVMCGFETRMPFQELSVEPDDFTEFSD